jgi:hypothetical protein
MEQWSDPGSGRKHPGSATRSNIMRDLAGLNKDTGTASNLQGQWGQIYHQVPTGIISEIRIEFGRDSTGQMSTGTLYPQNLDCTILCAGTCRNTVCSWLAGTVHKLVVSRINSNVVDPNQCCGSGMFYPGSGSDHCPIPDSGSGG